jgi:asparagine synthase (glutamine-hydrolysing)
MCGIAGFADFNKDFITKREHFTEILINMRLAIAHRGNDTVGEYLTPHCGLTQTRLTIRDLTGGNQPIIRVRNSITYAIIYNGEIYNCDELKSDLISKGYNFETTTDTEVILYAYMEYGIDSVKLLNGIFAYAIWDSGKNKLMLFRDRCGIKPLFYTIQNGTLVFGSEPKALFAHPDITPKITLDSLREVLGLGPARTEGNGVFKNVYEIKYGCVGIFSADGFTEKRYWQLESREHTDSYEKTVEHTSYLISDAIKRQMVSDVPVCSFLSGGVDSCIVTALASRYLSEAGKILNTFSFDFTGNDKYFKSNSFQPEQDRPYVDKMLKAYNLNHTYLFCEQKELADALYTAVDAKDLPGMADVDASLLHFCSLVKKHNKVTLTGECADEIFGGYPWFHRKDFFEADTFPWSVNMQPRKEILNKELADELDLDGYVKNAYYSSLDNVPRLKGESKEENRRREISYLNIKWFMTTLLDRMDRTSMYSGLEARVPFADHRIIEYVFNTPWKYKCHNGVVKGLLRDSAKGLLPDEILYRRKSPYPKTYNPEYEAILKDRLREIINTPTAPLNAILDKTAVMRIITSPSDYGKPFFGQLMAVPQLIAYMLQINYWMEKYKLSL